jgi:hypothetical protein
LQNVIISTLAALRPQLRPRQHLERHLDASWICARLAQITTKGSKLPRNFQPFRGRRT